MITKDELRELGWEYNGYMSQGDNIFFYKKSTVFPEYPALYEDLELILDKCNKIIIIDDEGIVRVNQLLIKSKVELLQLMEQIGI